MTMQGGCCEVTKKKTPDYFHCIEDKRFRNNVYEPEADTFVFLDGLDAEKTLLQEQLTKASRFFPDPFRVVEIGCGSGTVITHLQSIIDEVLHQQQAGGSTAEVSGDEGSSLPAEAVVEYHVVDINPLALEATKLTWEKSLLTSSTRPTLHLHEGSLFEPFTKNKILFDIVLFNPPYVPTSMEELEKAVVGKDVITAAWCGGPQGRVVVDKFLQQLPRFLKREQQFYSGGVCYVIAIKENNVGDLSRFAVEAFRNAPSDSKSDASVGVVFRRFTGEELSLLKIQRCAL